RSVDHDAADRLAFVHEVEGVVDLVERHGVGDQVVDIDLLVHVPVDDLRHVGAAACAAEGGALPYASGHQLERARRYFLARAGDADDDRLAPAAVTALERLPHRVHVADALEGEVGAAAGQIDDCLHDLVAADLVRIDEMRHAELLGHRALAGIEIDADDLVGADHLRALDDVEADAAESEHGDVRAGPYFRGVDHRADAGRHAAADVTNLVERRVLAD